MFAAEIELSVVNQRSLPKGCCLQRICVRCQTCVFCSEFMIRYQNCVVCSESVIRNQNYVVYNESVFAAKSVCSAMNL